MSPPICQAELIPINKNLIPKYEVHTISSEQNCTLLIEKIIQMDLSRARGLEQEHVSHSWTLTIILPFHWDLPFCPPNYVPFTWPSMSI
jgi:hypothetical protein